MSFTSVSRIAAAVAVLWLFPLISAAKDAPEALVLISAPPGSVQIDEPSIGEESMGDGETPLSPDPLFDEDFDELEFGPPTYDPWEPANRAVFRFNQQLDDWVFDPVTTGYRRITPAPLRRGIFRAFNNLNTPVYVVNNILQLRFVAAGETLAAFALNSTLGLAGFMEPGKEASLELQPADFGQTLLNLGIGAGPYLVVPILGPSSLRDGFGSVVDHFLQPLTYVLGLPTQLLWGGGAGLSLRDDVNDELEALEASSVDFYSALRSAYIQSRAHLPDRDGGYYEATSEAGDTPQDPATGVSAQD